MDVIASNVIKRALDEKACITCSHYIPPKPDMSMDYELTALDIVHKEFVQGFGSCEKRRSPVESCSCYKVNPIVVEFEKNLNRRNNYED